MEKIKLTIDEIAEINPEAMMADGFDNAILGMCIQFGDENGKHQSTRGPLSGQCQA